MTEKELQLGEVIVSRYKFGEILYLKTDTDQKPRMMIGILSESDDMMYKLSSGTQSSWHREVEISKEKNLLITSNN